MVGASSSCMSLHSMEHAMSAFYPKLPHGVGMIALSEEYFEVFRNDCMKRYMKMAEAMTELKSNRPSDFIDALVVMKKQCGVNELKLSDHGLIPDDFSLILSKARDSMGYLFLNDPRPMTDGEVMNILNRSYK